MSQIFIGTKTEDLKQARTYTAYFEDINRVGTAAYTRDDKNHL